MLDIYSGSVYVQIKSPCKKTFPFPFKLKTLWKNYQEHQFLAGTCFSINYFLASILGPENGSPSATNVVLVLLDVGVVVIRFAIS